MRELSKSIIRRRSNARFITDYFVGFGIDIGGKPDPLILYAELFPGIKDVRVWDLEDGDAEYMAGVPDESFDFVHSSHCLEHLRDPYQGLLNWFRILKPNGHLILTVPDEDLYEQGAWPSTYNYDHKWTFTINKIESWSPKSINIFELISSLGVACETKKIELLDSEYRYKLPRFDQTATPVAECSIEVILRKRSSEEINAKGSVKSQNQPDPLSRQHYNQYIDDYRNMKKSNLSSPPFSNLEDLK
jgi:SAM-dependent methyltransferase